MCSNISPVWYIMKLNKYVTDPCHFNSTFIVNDVKYLNLKSQIVLSTKNTLTLVWKISSRLKYMSGEKEQN